MKITQLKEFYSFVDVLISTLEKDDYFEIALTYSATIFRDSDEGIETVHVSDARALVTAKYDLNGLSVGGAVTKAVINWLDKSKDIRYKTVNNYMPFLKDIDEINIYSICINGVDMLEVFQKDNTLAIGNLVKYATEKTGNSNMKINISDNSKTISLIYVDEMFLRFVRMNNSCTLYVNNINTFDDVFKNKYLSGFSYCSGVPDVTSQISMFEEMAKVTDSEFKYVVK